MPSPKVSLPPTTFYQAVAAIFAVLLLSGVVVELRELGGVERDEPTEPSRIEVLRLAVFTVTCLAMFAGEVVTLDVLIDPPASPTQHAIISVTLLAGLVVVPAMAYIRGWQRLYSGTPRTALAGGFLALVVAAGIVAVVMADADQFEIGSWNVPKLYAARVYGTCANNGHCGLHVHVQPSVNEPRMGTLRDGDQVFVVCQRAAELFASGGGRSRIWDRLANGGWVSDLYLSTPRSGTFSPGIERC